MSGDDIHARMQDLFSDYLEGELDDGKANTAAKKAALEQHVAACTQCRVSLEKLRRTMGGLSGLKQKAPPSFLPAIQQQIFTRSRGRFFNRKWLLFGRIPFEWVSLAMIVAMLVYYIVTLQGSPSGVSPAP